MKESGLQRQKTYRQVIRTGLIYAHCENLYKHLFCCKPLGLWQICCNLNSVSENVASNGESEADLIQQ